MRKKILPKDYTKLGTVLQLHLPMDIEYSIPQDNPVWLVHDGVERMDLSKLYSTYAHLESNEATPRQMLELVVFAAMHGVRSSRAIEDFCQNRIDCQLLLDGKKAPDHSTIARFRSIHLAACAKDVLTEMDHYLDDHGELSGDTLFIDGTKIESFANKYKFVWKKSVSKHLAKMMEEIPNFFLETETTFGICIRHGDELHKRHLKKLLRKLLKLKKESNTVFVHGIGKRKTPLQKTVERLQGYISRLKGYETALHICGDRNSYAKTDHDATFMRMKEDAMLNGQLKPGYNIQFAVDAEYVVWTGESPWPTDVKTLIPFLEDLREHLGTNYRKIVADAGYESEENYAYLLKNGMISFIKPNNYEISKKHSFQNAIWRRENMAYDAATDSYLCTNGKQVKCEGTKKRKSRSGYVIENTVYVCHDCTGCPYKKDCIRGNNSKQPLEQREKHFEVSKRLLELRAEDKERITSEEGKLLRMNRSIQAEGAFADVKETQLFRRFLGTGHLNALTETVICVLAHNFNKLHHKIQSGSQGRYLFPLKETA
ncbi:IS1182 family transposase [Acidaminococcus fermentans]|uniref:IS1182 family transposase n=1 Tax=Acidaminococcus fermentans TaxID=905 RepID=UPI00242C1CFB|nr:IS1182 family transposase [Acidaminococcus fermentans]